MHAATPRPNARRLIAVTTTLLLAGAAACSAQGNNDPAPAKPSTPAAAPTTEPLREKFTPAQVDEYEEALARFTEYERVSEPIWAAGKVTPRAEEIFEEFWGTVTPLRTLEMHQLVGVRVANLPKVLTSEPHEVSLGEPASVQIRQCIDTSGQVFDAPPPDVEPKSNNPDALPFIRVIKAKKIASDDVYHLESVVAEVRPGQVELC